MDKNRRRTKLLGINFSTASNRLKKQVMYSLLQECGKATCYRCEKEIQSAEDVSLDHKEDWLNSDNPQEKFWDLDNLAFNHKKYNTIAGGLNKIDEYIGVTKLEGRKKPYQARYWDGKKNKCSLGTIKLR